MSTPSLKLDPEKTGILIVDFQERLAEAMPEETRARAERRLGELVKLAGLIGLPVIVTEQYPKGIGPTVPALREALAAIQPTPAPIEKTAFDCSLAQGFPQALEATGRTQWVVGGMEAHICVFQTARSLVERGLSVHVPEDAVASRRPADLERGLALMRQAGAVVTCAETAIFDLLREGSGPVFKEMSKALRAL